MNDVKEGRGQCLRAGKAVTAATATGIYDGCQMVYMNNKEGFRFRTCYENRLTGGQFVRRVAADSFGSNKQMCWNSAGIVMQV